MSVDIVEENDVITGEVDGTSISYWERRTEVNPEKKVSFLLGHVSTSHLDFHFTVG